MTDGDLAAATGGSPHLRRLMFSLVPFLVLFGGTEAGLRAADWPKDQGGFEHNEVYWTMDKELANSSIAHNEENATFLVSTNGAGLRVPVPKGASNTVMTLGCSTTFGWGTDDAESYPAQLDALMQAGGKGWRVINGGQPGYTTFQGLWLWDEVLAAYKPDVVLIGYIVQDARRAAYTDRSQAVLQRDARFLKHNMLYKLRLYQGLRAVLGQIQVRAKERPADDPNAGEYRVPPAEYAQNLRDLVSRVHESGGVPVLFGFPLEREGYTKTHRTILRAAALELEIHHLDLQIEMDAASRQETLYFPRDRGHANPAGNARIAQWVYSWLSEQGLISPEGA